jgi:hypothetical protein
MEMVHVLTQNPIHHMLKNPKAYISEDCDEPILTIVHDEFSPAYLLLGYDEKKKLYYFTLEDNEVSEDFYYYDGDLTKMFDEIMKGKGEYEIWVT